MFAGRRASDVGVGDAAGYTVNLPVRAASDDDVYASLVEHVAVPLALAYEPQLVLLSAGYDAHRDDPLAGCSVTEAGFASMTSSMQRVCAELEAPLGAVLEGGYDLRALARSVAATLEVLGGPPEAQARDDVAMAPGDAVKAARAGSSNGGRSCVGRNRPRAAREATHHFAEKYLMRALWGRLMRFSGGAPS